MFFRRLNGFEVDYPASLTPRSGVAGLHRNARPVWIGMGGRFASEYAIDSKKQKGFLASNFNKLTR
jgi:hypothetical protein